MVFDDKKDSKNIADQLDTLCCCFNHHPDRVMGDRRGDSRIRGQGIFIPDLYMGYPNIVFSCGYSVTFSQKSFPRRNGLCSNCAEQSCLGSLSLWFFLFLRYPTTTGFTGESQKETG